LARPGAVRDVHLPDPHEILHLPEEIGVMLNNLRDLRAERGWSQANLADKLNVSRQTVNALETGRYDPSLPLAFAIAKLFKLKVEDIFRP
jgi:putative transcriptional regulator